MQNYLFKIKFDGHSFHGWQIQDNAMTVQGEITDAFERIFQRKVTINGCSRTDSSVHANEFCFNAKIETPMSEDRMINALNAVLPKSISVFDCRKVKESFHARYDCKKKEYIYKILNSKYPDPFYLDRAYYYKHPLDEKVLCKQAQSFVGTHDFSAFCASGSSVKTTVRTVYYCTVERENDLVILRICADGFLYNMVRIIAGTLLDISRGKIENGSIADIIKSKNRENAGVTAQPQGLYLNKVFYEENIYE